MWWRAISGGARLIDRILFTTSRYGAAISGLSVVAIMLATIVDVSSRTLLNRSIPGLIEISAFAMVIAVFPALGYTQRLGKHVSMTLVVEKVPKLIALILQSLGMLIVLGILIWMIYSTGVRSLTSLRTAESSFGTVSIPVGPFRAIVCLGLALFAAELVRSICMLWRERN